MPKVKHNTLLRHLPHSVIRQLTFMLDPHGWWKELAMVITRPDGSERFNNTMISVLETSPKGTPTKMLLETWGTDNTEVEQLVEALTAARLYRAADYITVDLMGGEPVPRDYDERDHVEDMPAPKEAQCVRLPPGGRRVPPLPSEQEDDSMINDKELNLPSVPADPLPCPAELPTKPVPRPRKHKGKQVIAVGDSQTAPIKGPSFTYRSGFPSNPPGDPPEEDVVVMMENEDGQTFSNRDLERMTGGFNSCPVFEGGRLLGAGGFGEVFLGKAVDKTKQEVNVAVKRMYLANAEVDKTDVIESFMTELKVLSRFKHENLLSLIGYSEEADFICLVYQYMPNGSLQDRLACKDGTPPLMVPQRVSIAIGTARGLAHLHTHEEKPMIHKDVKSANILLDKNFTPKLGDFGQARQGPQGLNTTVLLTEKIIATQVYTAPEVFRGDISSKADAFAYGVVLLELLTGLPPLDESLEESADVVSRVEEFTEEGEIVDMVDQKAGAWPDRLVQLMYDLSERCLQTKKSQRPTISQVMPDIEKMSVG